MTTTQRLIVTLLKAAVTGENQSLPQEFSLEDALPIIKKQGLATLAYEGAVLCGISRKEPVMQELFKLYYSILVRSERQMQKVAEVCSAFEENGIDYLPFKGCVMKDLYPRQELRPMGDADILIRAEDYDRIPDLMQKLGFSLLSVEESVVTWSHPSLLLELHRSLYGEGEKDLFAYHGNAWGRAVLENGRKYRFSEEDTFLHLFTHFVKHYRSGGIGSRHVLDLWVYLRSNPRLDETYVEKELSKLHLLKFYHNVRLLLGYWFENGQKNDVVSAMTDWIFHGGSFGTFRAEVIFKTMREMERQPKSKFPRLKYYVTLCFPGIRQMRVKYPVLDKYPFLLPLGWAVRGLSVLFNRKDKFEKRMAVGKNISSDELSAKRAALNFVGLEFHEGQ